MASRKSPKGCTASGRLPRAASLTVLGEGDGLKNWMFEQPLKTKGCFQGSFVDS